MKKILKAICLILLIMGMWSCRKPNTANGKFIGTWHIKGANTLPNTIYDTVTFFSNGILQDKWMVTSITYAAITTDTMQLNFVQAQNFSHRSYYLFYSDTELHILSYSPNGQLGYGYDSIALIKN